MKNAKVISNLLEYNNFKSNISCSICDYMKSDSKYDMNNSILNLYQWDSDLTNDLISYTNNLDYNIYIKSEIKANSNLDTLLNRGKEYIIITLYFQERQHLIDFKNNFLLEEKLKL